MEQKLITIITPVYNRAHLIGDLYESIKTQINQNFIWMIVDDGSKDEIASVVEQFQKEGNIPIVFLQKENGGKHTALNMAFSYMDTELTIIVDSDDKLTPEATELIERIWKNEKEPDIAGCVFLRGNTEGERIGHSDLKNGKYNMIDAMFSHKIDGDKAEVFRCDILKKYRFPVYENEKFIGEDYIWRQIYLNYRMIYRNEIIYTCEYLEGGLTEQGRKLRIRCPLGGMANSKVSLCKEFPAKERIKRAWLYVCYGKFAGKKYYEIVNGDINRTLLKVNYLPGVMLYLYWKTKYGGGKVNGKIKCHCSIL